MRKAMHKNLSKAIMKPILKKQNLADLSYIAIFVFKNRDMTSNPFNYRVLLGVYLVFSMVASSQAQQVRTIPGFDIQDIIYLKTIDKVFATAANTTPGGNSLLQFTPDLTRLDTSFLLQGNPTVMAVSDDEKFIYISMFGSKNIKRFNVAQNRIDLTISNGISTTLPMRAFKIVPIKGQPESIIVHWIDSNNHPEDYIAVYDGGVKRPQHMDSNISFSKSINGIASGIDSSLLYISVHNVGLGNQVEWYKISAAGLEQNVIGATSFFGDQVGNSGLHSLPRAGFLITYNGAVMKIEANGDLSLVSTLNTNNGGSYYYRISEHPVLPIFYVVEWNQLTGYSSISLSKLTPVSGLWQNYDKFALYGDDFNIAVATNGHPSIGFYTDCTFDAPNLSVTSSIQTICLPQTDTITLSVSPVYPSYAWNFGVSNETEITLPFGTTNASCFAINESGCMSIQGAVANINATWPPSPPMAMLNNNLMSQTICNGDSAKIFVWDVVGTVHWSNGVTGEDIFVTDAGTYAARTEYPTGCFSQYGLPVNIHKLNVDPPITPEIKTIPDLPVCWSDTVLLYSSIPALNNWTENFSGILASTDTIRLPAVGQSVKLQRLSSQGCKSGIAELTLNFTPLPQASITYNPPNLVCLSAAPFDEYRWYHNQILIATTTVPVFTPTEMGFYTVSVLKDGCESQTFSSVYVQIVDVAEPDQNNNDISVTPTVTSHYLFVDTKSTAPFFYEILSNTGQVMQKDKTTTGQAQLDVSDLNTGFYYLVTRDEQSAEVRTAKFIRI
jgi:hypothetical protein